MIHGFTIDAHEGSFVSLAKMCKRYLPPPPLPTGASIGTDELVVFDKPLYFSLMKRRKNVLS